MRIPISSGFLLALISCLHPMTAEAAGPPKVVPLVKVEAGDRQIFQPRGGVPDGFYEMKSGLVLTKLRRFGVDRWQEIRSWDFSYLRSSDPDVDSDIDAMDIYPALYPLGPNTWAVAVISHRNEMYSGGGAEFVWADFVPLSGSEEDEPRPEFGHIPFSCQKMIRACFTEEEYVNSHHCSDEYRGWFTLQCAPSQRSGRYDWIITWYDWEWPSNTNEYEAKTHRTVIRLNAGSSTKTIERAVRKLPFCGGPQ